MASRRHTPGRSALIKAALVRAWGFDNRLPDEARQAALRDIEAVVPEVSLYMQPDAHGETALWCYVGPNEFELIPEILRSQANHIEEVRKDGTGIIYKSEDYPRGPILHTTKPGYAHPKPPTAWARILDDD